MSASITRNPPKSKQLVGVAVGGIHDPIPHTVLVREYQFLERLDRTSAKLWTLRVYRTPDGAERYDWKSSPWQGL